MLCTFVWHDQWYISFNKTVGAWGAPSKILLQNTWKHYEIKKSTGELNVVAVKRNETASKNDFSPKQIFVDNNR